jgi:hypothetical protein
VIIREFLPTNASIIDKYLISLAETFMVVKPPLKTPKQPLFSSPASDPKLS